MRPLVAALFVLLVASLLGLQPMTNGPARQRDLRYEASLILRCEPNFRVDPQARADFERLAQRDLRMVLREMPRWRYVEIAAHLAASVRDEHTTLYPDGADVYRLPLGFYWAKDGLVAVPIRGTPAGIHLGDRVLRIGGQSPPAIAKRMSAVIAGNPYHVRFETAVVYLSAQEPLEWLGAVDGHGTVPITLETAQGDVKRLRLPLEFMPDYFARLARADLAFYNRFEAPPGLPATGSSIWYSWRIARGGRYAIFWLHSFTDGPRFEKSLSRFFAAVKRRGVQRIVFDLRGDPGGHAEVVSRIVSTLLTRDFVDRKVYVLTSWGSASASVLFAEEILDDDLGVTVGQAMGENPAVHSTTYPIVLGNTGLAFQTADAALPAPLQSGATIQPAIPVPLTVADIQQGVNPIARWLDRLGTEGTARR